MFQPLGLFKQTRCPKQHDCDLHNCIFQHDAATEKDEKIAVEAYDPLSAGDCDPPPSKRRKLESPELTSRTVRGNGLPSGSVQLERSVPHDTHVDGDSKPREPVSRIKHQVKQPVSVRRTVSPPPKRHSRPSKDEEANIEKTETLVPRPVARAPAVLKVRLSFIEILYKLVNDLNSRASTNTKPNASSKFSDQEVIKWVLDEEQQVAATLSNDIYRNTMSQKILQLKRMTLEEWARLVDDRTTSGTTGGKMDSVVSTGLPAEEECQILRYLRTNLTGLDGYGYVTKAPSTAEIQKAKETIRATSGYELCDRCGVRFQVFPGRDAQGRLTTNGECHYHWAKLNRGTWQKTDHITGQAQSTYTCCGQQAGSEGCTVATTHVFKVTDPKRLAVLLQFEQTRVKSDNKARGPVAFDCEMAYTTYGLELVRVTAVSWPSNKELLDVLVRPYGEILDLNTRFSGVTQQQYMEAVPYSTAVAQDDNMSGGEKGARQHIRKVDSPATARELMFDLLTPDTPLIGHAIDNDLNVCRMIHPFVVDTVLLYPHPRGLPSRYGLKVLTSKYLSRGIQMGGDAGHDSKEDSIATGDLVRVKVKEKWQMMRLQGWKFEAGTLTPPGRQ